ncbi:MAG: type III pantothenate kinase [Kiritimatiellae bacterium]|nr:type III pantothenate kinase [Kiritimatiellia bacterium]
MKVARQRSVGEPVAVLNIGNTHTTLALVVGGRVLRRWRQRTARREPAVLARAVGWLAVRGAKSIVVGSVVPAATRDWRRAIRLDGRLVALTASPALARHVRFDYPRPSTLGADRLANIAAIARRGGGAVIVVDAGTATTFDAVIGDRYIGGVIAPGPAMFYDYLAERTARLPHLRAGPAATGSVGDGTVSAIRIGAEAGFAGMVRAILCRMRGNGGLRRARVVATGGAAKLVVRAVPSARHDPDLTLRGLAALAERRCAPECCSRRGLLLHSRGSRVVC